MSVLFTLWFLRQACQARPEGTTRYSGGVERLESVCWAAKESAGTSGHIVRRAVEEFENTPGIRELLWGSRSGPEPEYPKKTIDKQDKSHYPLIK